MWNRSIRVPVSDLLSLPVQQFEGSSRDLPDGVASAQANPLGNGAVLTLSFGKLLLGAESLVALWTQESQREYFSCRRGRNIVVSLTGILMAWSRRRAGWMGEVSTLGSGWFVCGQGLASLRLGQVMYLVCLRLRYITYDWCLKMCFGLRLNNYPIGIPPVRTKFVRFLSVSCPPLHSSRGQNFVLVSRVCHKHASEETKFWAG